MVEGIQTSMELEPPVPNSLQGTPSSSLAFVFRRPRMNYIPNGSPFAVLSSLEFTQQIIARLTLLDSGGERTGSGLALGRVGETTDCGTKEP